MEERLVHTEEVLWFESKYPHFCGGGDVVEHVERSRAT